jgi:Mitochondrial carrier protein
VLPPLLANAAVGAILYTSYLQILGAIHEPSSQSAKRAFPPPSPGATFVAGYAAGGVQSLVAAPMDALQVRFEKREKHYENKSMWAYGKGKLKEIGLRGVFAGWGLSFLKDSLGSGIFFSVFEYVKAQSYYKFVATYYGSLEPWVVTRLAEVRGIPSRSHNGIPIIKPPYVLEPGFLMLAGIAASVAQQGIIYPLNKIQTMHYERLEELDKKARSLQRSSGSGRMMRAYYHAYQETWVQTKIQAAGTGGVGRWLFRGFWWNSIKQTPATSAGLVIFELVRRRYGIGDEEIRINESGYDILLS